MPLTPNIGTLGRWLHSWVQPSGAIHGFHNHSVWGDNPFRYGDFTAGHSTFTAPVLMGLAQALRQRPDPRGQELLERMAQFQATSRQADGQFAHVGFQIGELVHEGLIHNVVPCVALAIAAPTERSDRAIRQVLAACDTRSGAWPSENSVANQDYGRLWARLVHMDAFGHREWHDPVAAGLDYLIDHFHVSGQPDPQCSGTIRHPSDRTGLEPAEYYGLMIHPLVLGWCRYGQPRYLAAARAIARHVARSSWRDAQGQQRFHRTWLRVGERWECLREPMLIGGMGLTLSGIQELVRTEADAELEQFLAAADQTYAHYQSPAGFFLAATGWGAEQDIIPATAWQSHDFYHLVSRHGVPADFWETLFQPLPGVAAVFGASLIWLETKTHWAVRGYHWANGLDLVGRKDRAAFGLDGPRWIPIPRQMPTEFIMPDEPKFLQTHDGIHRLTGRTDVQGLPAIPKSYRSEVGMERLGS